MRMLLLAACVTCASLAVPVHACWHEAASRYGTDADLLAAIASVESSGRIRARNMGHLQQTGSYDIGLMQINSTLLPELARHHIVEADLYRPCTNIAVGAWVLSQKFARYGVSWEAVGAYNAACSRLKGAACRNARGRYAWKVYRALQTRLKAVAPAKPARPQPLPLLLAVTTEAPQ